MQSVSRLGLLSIGGYVLAIVGLTSCDAMTAPRTSETIQHADHIDGALRNIGNFRVLDGAAADSAFLVTAQDWASHGDHRLLDVLVQQSQPQWNLVHGRTADVAAATDAESGLVAKIFQATTTAALPHAAWETSGSLVRAYTQFQGSEASHEIEISATDYAHETTIIPTKTITRTGTSNQYLCNGVPGTFCGDFTTEVGLNLPDCNVRLNASTTHNAYYYSGDTKFGFATWLTSDFDANDPCPPPPPPDDGGECGGGGGGGGDDPPPEQTMIVADASDFVVHASTHSTSTVVVGASPASATTMSCGGGGDDGSELICEPTWIEIQVSYDGGLTWETWWEGEGTYCYEQVE